MKVRIALPEGIRNNKERASVYVDDILLWGMEVKMDIDFYGFWTEPNTTWEYRDWWKYGIFIVEKDSAFMFSLKWGALQHKKKKKAVKE